MSAIVTDLLAALPAPPSGCAPHVSVSYWTEDPTVLPRMAAEHPGGDHKPGEWITWRDGDRINVQVSFVGDLGVSPLKSLGVTLRTEDDEQERKRLSDSAAAAEDFHVEDDGGEEEARPCI